MLGYVPSEHFDDKPLSGIEFFSYVESLTLPKEVCKYYTMDVWWNFIARSIRKQQQFTFMSTLKYKHADIFVSLCEWCNKYIYGKVFSCVCVCIYV